MEHLKPELHYLLSGTDEERKKYIRENRWIGYPRAKYIIDKLDELVEHPITHRMPNVLLVGETNNGKTIIVDRFQKKHTAIFNEENGGLHIPVLLIQAPAIPDERRFYNNILERLFVPYRTNDRVDHKLSQVIKVLRHVQLKILIIDEVHHILAGSMSKQRAFLNVIKYLANELRISIVGVGTREAMNAIQTDPQLANRFEPLHLPSWQMNEEYLRLLASFEQTTPLKKPSNLATTELSGLILSMSEGVIGEISRIIKKASEKAIVTGEERITKQLLNKLDWQAPSERKILSNKLAG
jgi:type II secretory pathway predicted ATPase ExeA